MTETREVEALKPCPFCGGAPRILHSTGEIVCPGEECFGPVTTAGNVPDSIRQWNTRSSPAGEVERLREKVARALYACDFQLNRMTEFPSFEDARGHTQERYLARADAALAASPSPPETRGTAREQIARIIDPTAFENWKGYYNSFVISHLDEAGKIKASNYHYGEDIKRALAKADAILALPAASGKAE